MGRPSQPLLVAVAAALVALLLLGAGALAGRHFFPVVRQVQVVEKVLQAVQVPGETKVVTLPVPGPTQIVQVPVEVVRYVDRPGQDRIVTVTQPVNVPVEVVKREWPQSITVRVGSVLTKEYGWATPVNPDLVIGQVAPGVYAVPEQEGWKLESVTAETKVPSAGARARWHIEVRPGLGFAVTSSSIALGPALMVDAHKDHLSVNATAGYNLGGGAFGSIFVGWRF